MIAKLYLMRGDLPLAETFLRQAEFRGITDETKLARANLALQRGDLPGARGVLDEVIATGAASGEAYFSRAMSWLIGGNPEQALPDLEQAVERHPHGAVYRYYLGFVLADLGRDWRRAAEHLGVAIQLNPKYPMAYVVLSRLLAMSGDYSAAQGVLEQGLQRLPTDPRLLSARTNLSLLTGQVGEAFRAAALLAMGNPDDPIAAANFANLLLVQERYDDALAVCQRLYAHGKATAELKCVEATTYEGRHPPRFAEAARAYDQAMTLDPNDWRAANNLGQLLLRRTDGDRAQFARRALEVLEEARRREPERLEPKLNLALARVRVGDRHGASLLAQEILAAGLEPKHPIAEQARRLMAMLGS